MAPKPPILGVSESLAPPELRDAVGECFIDGTPHLGMNSKAHSENPLKRVQELFDISFFNPLWV
jgi:hypothetical protein